MKARALCHLLLLAALLFATPARAADPSPFGFEVGVRTGYAFAAGDLGAPANGTDAPVGDYVSGQWPLWLDAGLRLWRYYLGAYFQYGFGFVNEDRQDLCRNANVDCSAADIRVGIMGRYHFAPAWRLSPWVGFGMGYEWGSFSVHQSLIGTTNTDYRWSGFELANLQVGADFHLTSRLLLAPFLSFSFGQFRGTSTTTRFDNTTTTTDEDIERHSLHEWILIGLRFAVQP